MKLGKIVERRPSFTYFSFLLCLSFNFSSNAHRRKVLFKTTSHFVIFLVLSTTVFVLLGSATELAESASCRRFHFWLRRRTISLPDFAFLLRVLRPLAHPKSRWRFTSNWCFTSPPPWVIICPLQKPTGTRRTLSWRCVPAIMPMSVVRFHNNCSTASSKNHTNPRRIGKTNKRIPEPNTWAAPAARLPLHLYQVSIDVVDQVPTDKEVKGRAFPTLSICFLVPYDALTPFQAPLGDDVFSHRQCSGPSWC